MNPSPADPVEPDQLVKAGVTTSEWKILVTFLKQMAATGTVTVVAYVSAKVGLHYNIPPETLTAVVGFEIAGAFAIVGYAISRGIAKFNVPGAAAHTDQAQRLTALEAAHAPIAPPPGWSRPPADPAAGPGAPSPLPPPPAGPVSTAAVP